jgi:energy-converting hydrogenase Eha subunit A
MFLVRLVLGLLKGAIVGGAVGFGLVAAGMAVPSTLIAYLAAAACGVLVGLVAGKPIWARDSRIEVGMKAAAGALLAPVMLFAVRRFVAIGFPTDMVTSLPGLESVTAASLDLSTFAVTSLAIVTALIAAFFDADNQPVAEDDKAAAKKSRIATAGSGGANRIAGAGAGAEADDEEAEAPRRARR